MKELNKKFILVTGGAGKEIKLKKFESLRKIGYIGSHTVCELLKLEKNVIVLDNFSNSSVEALNRLKILTKKDFIYFNVDILDRKKVEKIFEKFEITSVIHFAGKKSVTESLKKTKFYYENNVNGTKNILEVAIAHKHCISFIFSSSACVYGKTEELPVTEDTLCNPPNPYGKTKLICEELIRNMCNKFNTSDQARSKCFVGIILRYFNPVGAHSSGLIGEDPIGIPQNLMPLVAQVAIGRRPCVQVFGNDWNTTDGTGCRDYIHVTDLAKGHIRALEKAEALSAPKNKTLAKTDIYWNCPIYNLGTGKSTSVLEVIRMMEEVSERKIKIEFGSKREGDIAEMYASVNRSEQELTWTAKLTLRDMCLDHWRWQMLNPLGYATVQKNGV